MTTLPYMYTPQERPEFDLELMTPGTLLVPVRDDLARFNQFTFSLAAMVKPEGTRLVVSTGLNLVQSLNDSIARDFTGEWLALTGDDHVLPPYLIPLLLNHNLDIVGSVCFTRRAPFHWTLFKEREDGGTGWEIYTEDELPARGVVQVGAVGSAGLLIRRNVIEALLEDRGYVFSNTGPQSINEDLEFCTAAARLGFPTHVDMSIRLGHIGTMWTAPHYDEEQGWGVSIEFPGGFGRIFIPGTDHRVIAQQTQEVAAA